MVHFAKTTFKNFRLNPWSSASSSPLSPLLHCRRRLETSPARHAAPSLATTPSPPLCSLGSLVLPLCPIDICEPYPRRCIPHAVKIEYWGIWGSAATKKVRRTRPVRRSSRRQSRTLLQQARVDGGGWCTVAVACPISCPCLPARPAAAVPTCHNSDMLLLPSTFSTRHCSRCSSTSVSAH